LLSNVPATACCAAAAIATAIITVITMRSIRSRRARLLASATLLAAIAAATAGCQTTQTAQSPGSMALASSDQNEAAWRHDLDVYGPQYRANPSKLDVALRYAQALRATSQRAQAVAVLERLAMENPRNKAVLGEYGRALAEGGDYNQALEVLSRAHSPDQPDWHILSAQGAVLDQLGRHQEAQRYYLTALKIVPGEPSVLSNLGLSYALSKDLPNAEATLRSASAANRSVDPRVRQNLALVVGLQGRYAEAEQIAAGDLPPDQAAANVAYLRQMMARGPDQQKPAQNVAQKDSQRPAMTNLVTGSAN
jgi:Flp pilus assembly protein TadD